MKVEVSPQVLAFVRRQPPASKRRLRLALRALESERGDIRALEGPLQAYSRLRVGACRILFIRVSARTGPAIRCIYAEHRSTVYTVFAEMLRRHLLG